MSIRMHDESRVGQPISVDQSEGQRSTAVDHALALLRKAAQDCGYTLDALDAFMSKNRAYIGKVFNGEKPCTLEFQMALPADVRAKYHQLSAESHGLIVVEPVDAETAHRHLVSGLFGLLSSRLPARASSMAKASLPFGERRAVAR